MIKKIICVVLLLVLGSTVFMLAICDKGVDEGLSAGFATSSGGSGGLYPSDFCAYKSDVSQFDINDVTLHFFYGGIFGESIEHHLENGRHRNITSVRLYFHNQLLGEFYVYAPYEFAEENLYFIREISERYVSEKYRWKGDEYELEDGFELTIPTELFIGESGIISFIVAGYDTQVDRYKYITGKSIYYEVNGDRVTLSDKKTN